MFYELLYIKMSCSNKITIFNNRDLVLYIATFIEQFDIFKLCLVSSITRKIILASSQIPLYHQIRLFSSHQLIVNYHSKKSILRNNIDTINNNPYIKSLLDNLIYLVGNHELLKLYCSCKYSLIDPGVISNWLDKFKTPIRRNIRYNDISFTGYFEDAEGYHYAENQWRQILQCVKNTGCNICEIRNTFFDGNCFECIHLHEFEESLYKFKLAKPCYKPIDKFKDMVYDIMRFYTLVDIDKLLQYNVHNRIEASYKDPKLVDDVDKLLQFGNKHYIKKIKLELQNIQSHHDKTLSHHDKN
jgi:hypothetical protein